MKIKKKKRQQKLEDGALLKQINAIFMEKRGYVFKMPPPGSKVVSLMSGGLDTTVVTAQLLDTFALEVYPIHFVRPMPAANPQKMEQSVRYFCNLFQKRYGKKCHKPVFLPLQFPVKQTEERILEDGQVILNSKTGQRRGIPFQPSAFIHETINFLYTLSSGEQKKIKTIFASTLASNVRWYAYESLASYRALNLEVCTMLSDFSWQITSLPIEKEMGWYKDKEDLIKEGKKLGLPLEYTYTCQKDLPVQCGRCIVCLMRRSAFKNAGVEDKTIYETNKREANQHLRKVRK